jgi:Alpha/beta hydrolase family
MIFKPKFYKILVTGLLVITTLATSFTYYIQPSRANTLEFDLVAANPKLDLIEKTSEWIIKPKNQEINGQVKSLIFITGGKVEEKAYLHNLSLVSERTGMIIYVPKILFNLAFFDVGASDRIVDKYQLKQYYVAGHSLGGVVACLNVKSNQSKEELKGLILMASYCDQEISEFKGGIMSLVGSDDGVINSSQKILKDQSLPKQRQLVQIQGMNHGQFGSYGKQAGDKEPAISNVEASLQVANYIKDFVAMPQQR